MSVRVYVCALLSSFICDPGMKAATWDNHAHISTTPSSCCISPRLSLLSSGFGVCYLQHSRKQTPGFKIHPPLPTQNQLLERWNSPITQPNDNRPESAMIWQTTIGTAAAYDRCSSTIQPIYPKQIQDTLQVQMWIIQRSRSRPEGQHRVTPFWKWPPWYPNPSTPPLSSLCFQPTLADHGSQHFSKVPETCRAE